MSPAGRSAPLRLAAWSGRVPAETAAPLVVELPANVLASFPELIHALPQAPRQVRQLFRPEEDKNDEEYDKKIRTTQIPNP